MTAPVPRRGKRLPVRPRTGGRLAAEVDNARSPLLAGFVGSLFMVIGSLGVGWLAPVSELRRVPLFIWMRTEAVGVALSIVLLAVGGMLLVRAWLRLGQRVRVWGAGARKATLQATWPWGLPLMFSVPLFSRDVYAYIGQGRLMVEGFNPYENGISALSNYFQLGADKMWTEAPVPYGQLFLWIEQFVVWSTNVHPEASIMLFRLAALVGVVLCVIYVPKLAELHGVNPHRALWLTAANPLFLTNFIASVHNDALMIGLALAGLYYCATRRVILGIVLVTLSISVKPITVVFLPFIGLLWAGKDAGWPRKFVFWALTAGISLALLYAMSLVNGFGFGWINGLSAPGSIWIWYAPVGLLGLIVASISNAFGLDGWGLAKWVLRRRQAARRRHRRLADLPRRLRPADAPADAGVRRRRAAGPDDPVLVRGLAHPAVCRHRHPRRLAGQGALLHRVLLHGLRDLGPAGSLPVPADRGPGPGPGPGPQRRGHHRPAVRAVPDLPGSRRPSCCSASRTSRSPRGRSSRAGSAGRQVSAALPCATAG